MASGYLKVFRNRRMLIWLIGTSGGWALLDFCYYGNTISPPEILKLLNPNATLLRQHADPTGHLRRVRGSRVRRGDPATGQDGP